MAFQSCSRSILYRRCERTSGAVLLFYISFARALTLLLFSFIAPVFSADFSALNQRATAIRRRPLRIPSLDLLVTGVSLGFLLCRHQHFHLLRACRRRLFGFFAAFGNFFIWPAERAQKDFLLPASFEPFLGDPVTAVLSFDPGFFLR
jgi:hypothetical protein